MQIRKMIKANLLQSFLCITYANDTKDDDDEDDMTLMKIFMSKKPALREEVIVHEPL